MAMNFSDFNFISCQMIEITRIVMINKAIFRPPNRTENQTEYIPSLIHIAINKMIKINANIMIFHLLKN